MARRSMSRVATTRRMTKELPESYDDLVAALFLFAEVADNPEARDDARIRAGIAWRDTLAMLGGRVADEAREVRAWGSTRPKAV